MKFCHFCLVVFIFSAAFSADTFAADSNGPVRGPFFSGTIRGPKSNEAIAMKGIVVTLGPDKKNWACYDTDLMRFALAWGGQFLEFGNTLSQIAWPPPPQVKGDPIFGTRAIPGWAPGADISDPRDSKEGPLPKEFAHYRGLYQSGDQVVFSYTVGGTAVLEMPGLESSGGVETVTRTFNIAPANGPLTVSLCYFDTEGGESGSGSNADGSRFVFVGKEHPIAIGFTGSAEKVHFLKASGDLKLVIPAHRSPLHLKVLFQAVPDGAAQTA